MLNAALNSFLEEFEQAVDGVESVVEAVHGRFSLSALTAGSRCWQKWLNQGRSRRSHGLPCRCLPNRLSLTGRRARSFSIAS